MKHDTTIQQERSQFLYCGTCELKPASAATTYNLDIMLNEQGHRPLTIRGYVGLLQRSLLTTCHKSTSTPPLPLRPSRPQTKATRRKMAQDDSLAESKTNFTLDGTVGSRTAWPPLSAAEPAVLWESLCQLTLAVSDIDQNEPVVTRWSL